MWMLTPVNIMSKRILRCLQIFFVIFLLERGDHQDSPPFRSTMHVSLNTTSFTLSLLTVCDTQCFPLAFLETRELLAQARH